MLFYFIPVRDTVDSAVDKRDWLPSLHGVFCRFPYEHMHQTSVRKECRLQPESSHQSCAGLICFRPFSVANGSPSSVQYQETVQGDEKGLSTKVGGRRQQRRQWRLPTREADKATGSAVHSNPCFADKTLTVPYV